MFALRANRCCGIFFVNMCMFYITINYIFETKVRKRIILNYLKS